MCYMDDCTGVPLAASWCCPPYFSPYPQHPGGVAFTSTPRTHDTGSRLYILNGAYKCDKEDGDCAAGEAGPLPLLRQVAASFDAGVAEQQ
jgi:hypothetical protein